YRHLAAGVTTSLVGLIVLLPIGLAVTTATLEGISLVDELQLTDVRVKLDQLRHEFGLQIPREQDVRHIEATLHARRERQRSGETLAIQAAQLDNLLVRIGNIKTWLSEHAGEAGLDVDAAELETQLVALRDSPAGSVESDDALQLADAEFR